MHFGRADLACSPCEIRAPPQQRPVTTNTFRRGFAGHAHAALRLLHGDVECGVDGEAELVECAANMDRMASGSERCQHQIDPGIDGE
jgi:hypothetical protein